MAAWRFEHLLPSVPLCITLMLSACGSSAAPCETLAEGDRATLDLGALCVRDLSARALVDGQWQAAELKLSEQDGARLLTASTDRAAQAFELSIPRLDADRMLQQGYQSWSFSGAIRMAPQVALAEDGAPVMLAATTGDVVDEERGVSYGSTVLGGESGPYLVVGAASTLRANTGIASWIEDDAARVSIIYGTTREPLRADDDGITRSEPIVFIASQDANAGLDRLRDEMQAHLPGDARAARKPPGGWFSWNERYADVDDAFIRDHIEVVKRDLLPLGMPLVELDDGWMPKWGDWTSNERFPDSVEALAGEIRAADLQAGIWLAPFLIDVESEAAQTLDKDLLVHDQTGEPLVHRPTGLMSSYYILDGSNPASMAHVTEVISDLSNAGYSFFKLDYLYAATIPGLRHADMTGVEALRNGMTLIRQAMGEDAILNACGVPIHPILGLTDSLRIGPDTAFEGFDLALPLVTSAARSYAARSYLFPLAWPDADQTQLRDSYSGELAQMSALVAALAGPAYSLGDDLVSLASERQALGTDAQVLDLAASEAPARPVDLMKNASIDVIPSPSLETAITPGYTRAPPPRRFTATGASGKSYELEFEWFEPYGVTVIEN